MKRQDWSRVVLHVADICRWK